MKNFEIAYRITPQRGFDANSRKMSNRYGLYGGLFKHLDGEIELAQFLKGKVGEQATPQRIVGSIRAGEPMMPVDERHIVQYPERLVYYAVKDLLELVDIPSVVGLPVFANWIIEIMRESPLNQFVVFPTRIYLVDSFQSPSVNDWSRRVREKLHSTGELDYSLDNTPYTDNFSTICLLGEEISVYTDDTEFRALSENIHIRDDLNPNNLPPFFKPNGRGNHFVNSATKALLESRGIKAVRFDNLEYAAWYAG